MCTNLFFNHEFQFRTVLILLVMLIFILIGCSQPEYKRLTATEELPEFGLFLDHIDTSDIYLYNQKSTDTKCYYIDSLIVFVKFNRKNKSDTSNYLLEVKENSVSLFKPKEKLAETYELGTELSLYSEVKKIIDKNIIDEKSEFYIMYQNKYVFDLYKENDSLINFIGLWHGKKGRSYDYSDTYFYVEWLSSYHVIQHYSFVKTIECDFKFLFSKIE